jgi:putative hydrolase of the HAD superfamily
MNVSIPVDFSKITTILFDMDGTLIEHTWQLEQITHALFDRFAGQFSSLTHDDFFNTFWQKRNDMWAMMLDGILDGPSAAKYSYVNTLRALGQDDSLAGAMLAEWDNLVLNEVFPFEDTFEVLTALRSRYTTGILTNGYVALQRAKIKRHNLAAYVDFTLVSEEAGYHKPDKRVFLKALELAGNPPPGQTIYVGDNPVADIEGAKNAGLHPILMDPRDYFSAPADVIKIHQLRQLLPLLNKKPRTD